MDYDSPDVAKDFPGLYASELQSARKTDDQGSDYSDDGRDKSSKKDVLKRKEKKESKKDKGYVAFEGESSEDEIGGEQKASPTKGNRKSKSAFKFSKRDKLKEKSSKSDRAEKKKESKAKLKLKDRKKSKRAGDEDVSEKDDRPIFGVPLDVAVKRSKCHDGIQLPAIVRECVDYIEEHGLSCEGIYRLSGVKSKVQKLRAHYNRAEQVCLLEHEPHVIASLLKSFLRDLPDPVLTYELMPRFEEVSALKDEQKKAEGLANLISELPLANRLLLSWIFVHMQHIIDREKVNKMNMQNVAIVLSPTMKISHRVLNALFAHGRFLFQDVVLKKYVPPLKPETSRLSLELPDTPTTIQDEITKQESLLAQLHAEMFSGLADQEKEEQLWEVQRVVTQLKRKLRFVKHAQQTEEKEAAGEGSAAAAQVVDVRLHTASCNQHPAASDQHKCTVYVAWPTSNLAGGTEVESNQQQEGTVEEAAQSVVETLSRKSSVSSVAGSLKSDSDNDEVQESSANGVKGVSGEVVATDNAVNDEEHMLHIEEEELMRLNQELRQKIDAERLEVDKLREKIETLHYAAPEACNSDDNVSDADEFSDDECDNDFACDDDRWLFILQRLIESNQQLEVENAKLVNCIQREREMCVDINIQMRLLKCQQKKP